MNKKIKCSNREFDDIKNDKQTYKIFDNNLKLEYLKKYELINNETGESLEIQITSVKRYSTIDDILSIVNLNSFGTYKDKADFINYINKNYNHDRFLVCRIKKVKTDVTITDKELLKKIKIDTLVQENLGLSGCLVYHVTTEDDKEAILKIQNIEGNDNLKEEYEVLKFLKNKISVADVYYYNLYKGKEYLLRQYIKGEVLYKFNNFGYKLGKELKNIHKYYTKDCKYQKFSTNNLLNNALEKINVVYQLRSSYFKKYSKDELITFLKENKPNDDALIHGDFSLTNILINDNKYYYIDLGNVSISTKYFDIYVLKKSLKINNLESEFEEFLKGYGIKKINDNYMYWMELIELSYN